MHLPIQKAKHLKDELTKKTPDIKYDYLISEKLDGWYAYMDYNAVTELWTPIQSSVGRTIPAFQHLLTIVQQYMPKPKENMRFIMEAIIPDTPFHITNGVFNRSIGNYKCSDVVFNIHDLIYLDTYYKETSERNKAVNRYLHLTKLEVPTNLKKNFKLHPVLGVSNNPETWKTLFDAVTYEGGEGIILKRATGLYQAGKRNASLLKMKLECEKDLLCVGVYETIGEKGNVNTNITVQTKQGIQFPVRVGKHEDIALIKKDVNNILQKVVVVKAMEELESGKLREPRFVSIRYDKTAGQID